MRKKDPTEQRVRNFKILVIVGSLGINPHSDLRIAAGALGVSPWWIRIPGFLAALGAVLALCWAWGWWPW